MSCTDEWTFKWLRYTYILCVCVWVCVCVCVLKEKLRSCMFMPGPNQRVRRLRGSVCLPCHQVLLLVLQWWSCSGEMKHVTKQLHANTLPLLTLLYCLTMQHVYLHSNQNFCCCYCCCCCCCHVLVKLRSQTWTILTVFVTACLPHIGMTPNKQVYSTPTIFTSPFENEQLSNHFLIVCMTTDVLGNLTILFDYVLLCGSWFDGMPCS